MAANILARVAVQITANTAQMVGQMGVANKRIGAMESSLMTLKNTMLGTFGAYAVLHAIQNTVNTLADFDREMTQVKVITGATGASFDRLEKDALKLGSTTKFTAKEVAGLQLEFGRLGFSTKEILLSTKATVDLATATGEDLVRSAEIAGSTLRGFNLHASEMGRVTNVIAKGLNESALSMDSFADGIKYVAPVAASLNISIEETTSMLSVLADAGIKGTMAGTSLRRIFTLLTKDGGDLNEKLDELAKTGITLAQANDEVGLYAQTSLLILTRYAFRINELKEKMALAKDEAEKMATAMNENLDTAIKISTNSYDAFILSLGKSKGVIKSIADEISLFWQAMAADPLAATGAVLTSPIGGPMSTHIALQAIATKGLMEFNKEKERYNYLQERDIEQAKKAIEVYGTSRLGLIAIEVATQHHARGKEILAAATLLITEAEMAEAKAIADTNAERIEANKITEEAIKHASELAFLKRQAAQASLYAVDNTGNLINSDPSGMSNEQTKGILTGAISSLGLSPEEIDMSSKAMAGMAMASEHLKLKLDEANLAGAGLNFTISEEMQNAIKAATISIGSDLAQGIGELATGLTSAADVMARAADGIINTLLAITSAKLVAQEVGTKGFAGLAFAVAGLSVLKGVFSGIRRNSRSSSGGSGSSYGSSSGQIAYALAQDSSPTRIEGEVVVKGQDLYVALTNYERNKKSTHG